MAPLATRKAGGGAASRKIDAYNSTSTGHQVGDGAGKPAAYRRHRAAMLQAQFGTGTGTGAGTGGGTGGQATLFRYLASAKAAGGGGQKKKAVVEKKLVGGGDTAATARTAVTSGSSSSSKDTARTTSSRDTTKTTLSRDTAAATTTATTTTTTTCSDKDTTAAAISKDTAATGDAAICSPATATGPLKETKAPSATTRDITPPAGSPTTAAHPKTNPPKTEKAPKEEEAAIDTPTTTTTPTPAASPPKAKTTAATTTTSSSSSSPNPPPPLFHPLTIHISGTTTPHISDHALKRLLALHGARIAPSVAQRTTTHVIIGAGGSGAGGVLAAGKLQRELARRRRGVKFVGVAWVLDSVKAGRRLPEGRYAVGVKAAGQRGVGEMFAVKGTRGGEGFGG